MPLRLLVPVAAAMLAACSSPSEVAERTGVELDEAVRASAETSSAQGVALSEETALFHFELAYPAQVAAIPALAAKLEADARAVEREMAAEARASKADAAANGYPFNPHGYGAKWQVVADLPGYPSLSNAFSAYSGGAHGMYGTEGYVWDKAMGRGLASDELFRSPGQLGAAMGGALCAALDRERRARRGGEPAEGMFAECPGLDEATILVGSANGRTFDRITVYFGPYVAGPYAEGPYEFDFAMTAAMLAAVRPAHRAAFSAGK